MIDLENGLIQQWLRKISLSGRLISIDKTAKLAGGDEIPDVNGFAVLNAINNEEVNLLLQECPELDTNNVMVYLLKN